MNEFYGEDGRMNTLDVDKMRDKVFPLVNRMLHMIQESGINANDALDIPGHLNIAIKESNRFARHSTQFVAYIEDWETDDGFRLVRPEDYNGTSPK